MLNDQDNSLPLANLVINNLLEEEIIINGWGLSSSYTTRIVIGNHGAGTEYVLADGKILGTNIPALNVYEWNLDNLSYLNIWLSSVLSDKIVKVSWKIKISTSGSWKEKISI